MKNVITTCLIFFLPSFILRPLLRVLGHKIGKNVRIGFSIIKTKSISIEDNSKIGHFNLVLNDEIRLLKNSKIGYLNLLKGPFTLHLKERAAIGNKNYFTRGYLGLTFGESILELGVLTKITTGHHIDLTQSVIFGDYSILAGIRSQIWTHGYYHAETGKDRIRIDGAVTIGDNVYIGSGCIFNPGVNISNAIHIGGGAVISKNLNDQGMYVSQALRYIPQTYENIKNKLEQVDAPLVEKVYLKQ